MSAAVATYARNRTSNLDRPLLAVQVHETAALVLAAAALWSAVVQLQASGWGLWAPPLVIAAVMAVVRAVSIWVGPSLSLSWRRAAVWGALILVTPVAMATMTTIDFAALAACQLLLVAGALAELSKRPRVVAFLWLLPVTIVIGMLAFHSTL